MSDFSVVSLSRQTGLLKELSVLANNIANAGTAGYKREASVFTEYVSSRAGAPSVSMGSLRGHYAVFDEGSITETGGTFDMAIMGEGMFAVQSPEGVFLTRQGQFTLDADGQLVTPDGNMVLDDGGSAIAIPPDAASIVVAPDGTISADGLPVAQLGVFAADPDTLVRHGSTMFEPTTGYHFVDDPIIRQGMIEGSNVNPVLEMARLIEAQRLFEAGQNLLDSQKDRNSQIIRLLGEA